MNFIEQITIINNISNILHSKYRVEIISRSEYYNHKILMYYFIFLERYNPSKFNNVISLDAFKVLANDYELSSTFYQILNRLLNIKNIQECSSEYEKGVVLFISHCVLHNKHYPDQNNISNALTQLENDITKYKNLSLQDLINEYYDIISKYNKSALINMISINQKHDANQIKQKIEKCASDIAVALIQIKDMRTLKKEYERKYIQQIMNKSHIDDEINDLIQFLNLTNNISQVYYLPEQNELCFTITSPITIFNDEIAKMVIKREYKNHWDYHGGEEANYKNFGEYLYKEVFYNKTVTLYQTARVNIDLGLAKIHFDAMTNPTHFVDNPHLVQYNCWDEGKPIAYELLENRQFQELINFLMNLNSQLNLSDAIVMRDMISNLMSSKEFIYLKYKNEYITLNELYTEWAKEMRNKDEENL